VFYPSLASQVTASHLTPDFSPATVERETEEGAESIYEFKGETKGREEDKEGRREANRVIGAKGDK
jgi:hypothetical protein